MWVIDWMPIHSDIWLSVTRDAGRHHDCAARPRMDNCLGLCARLRGADRHHTSRSGERPVTWQGWLQIIVFAVLALAVRPRGDYIARCIDGTARLPRLCGPAERLFWRRSRPLSPQCISTQTATRLQAGGNMEGKEVRSASVSRHCSPPSAPLPPMARSTQCMTASCNVWLRAAPQCDAG